MAKRAPEQRSGISYGMSAGEEQMQLLAKSMLDVRVGGSEERPSFAKSILNVLNGPGSEVERLAFESDPTQKNAYAGVYKAKLRLIPDSILKRIAVQDSLVATIVRARQNQISAFGRPRPTRFDNGFIIQPDTGIIDSLDEDGKRELTDQITKAARQLETCGNTIGLREERQATFSEYLSLSVRSAIVVGRIATEVVWVEDPAGGSDEDGKPRKQFHHFVATDAGTIYRATPNHDAAQSIRDEAFHLLQSLTTKKLEKERYQSDDYSWVQVVDGKPVEVFTSDEMKVYNFYAVPDVELDGYPVTPLDTVITAVTTHINITTHNKMYFQSGRATRGMLVIQSDDVSLQAISNVKQQFNASINNVNNAWRMPVFGCGQDEKITWQPIDSGGGRDMEFQYLTDMNMREIISAFMMSPDELLAYGYLSRGTNNQALSEGNNEYKLEAARDLGIRPLLSQFEDFINNHLLPLIDPDLAKKAKVRLKGLDADNAEKEAVRTQQDMAIWMSMDDIMERVEKKPIGAAWGGAMPLNQVWHTLVVQPYLTVGEIKERFFGVKGASKDPNLAYIRDANWFQWVQMQQAAQQAQQQAAAGQPPGGAPGGGGGPPQGGGSDDSGGGDDQKGGNAFGQQTEKQKSAASPDAGGQGAGGGQPGAQATDLARSIDMAFQFLSKAEADLPADKRRLVANHRKMVDYFGHGMEEDAAEAIRQILDVAEHHAPRAK